MIPFPFKQNTGTLFSTDSELNCFLQLYFMPVSCKDLRKFGARLFLRRDQDCKIVMIGSRA